MPLAGRDADVLITSLVPVASTGETLSYSTATREAKITAATHRHLDPDSTGIVLYANSTAVSSTGYTINHVQGVFRLNSTTWSSTDDFTADVDYLPATSVAGGREWQLNVEADMFEISTFGSGGWKEFLPNLNGATVSIGRYWADSDFMDYLTNDARFVVELVPLAASSTTERYEGFARVASDNISASVDAIVGETINLVIDGQMFYTEQ